MLLFAASIYSCVLVFLASNECHEVVGRGRVQETSLDGRQRDGGAMRHLLGGWRIGHTQYWCDTTRRMRRSGCLYMSSVVLMLKAPIKDREAKYSGLLVCRGHRKLSKLWSGTSAAWWHGASRAGQAVRYVLCVEIVV